MINKIINKLIYVIPSAIMLLALLTDKVFYFMNDDYIANFISLGSIAGKPSSHLVYVNIIIGAAIKILNTYLPGLNWFGLMYIAVILADTYAALFVFKKYTNKWMAFAAAILVEVTGVAICTYTALSYITMLVGAMYAYEYIKETKKRNLVIAIAFFLVGYWLRLDTLASFMVLISPAAVYAIVKNRSKNCIVIIVSIALLIGASALIDHQAYTSKQWQNFMEYSDARRTFTDRYFAKYEKIDAEDIMSENDYYMAWNWNFGDKETYSVDNWAKLSKANSKYRFETNPLRILLAMMVNIRFWILIMMMLVGMYGSRKLLVLLQGGAVMALEGALLVMNRAVTRVELPIYVCAILIMLLICVTDETIKKQRKVAYIAASIVVIMMGSCVSENLTNYISLYPWTMKADRADINQAAIRKYVKAHKENLYVTPSFEKNKILYCIPILSIDQDKASTNVIAMGDWDIYNDQYYNTMEKYGIEEKEKLLISLATSDNVKLLCRKPEKDIMDYFKATYKYLKEHTDGDVKARKVEDVEGTEFGVYEFEVE